MGNSISSQFVAINVIVKMTYFRLGIWWVWLNAHLCTSLDKLILKTMYMSFLAWIFQHVVYLLSHLKVTFFKVKLSHALMWWFDTCCSLPTNNPATTLSGPTLWIGFIEISLHSSQKEMHSVHFSWCPWFSNPYLRSCKFSHMVQRLLTYTLLQKKGNLRKGVFHF